MMTLETSYFRVNLLPVVQTSGRYWRARAVIYRKDSEERVESVSVREDDPSKAEQLLVQSAERKLASLGKPADWGKDPTIPRIIHDYLQLRDCSYGLNLQAEDAVSEEQAARIRGDADAYETLRMNELRKRIAGLNEDQKLQLVSPTEAERKTPGDPWILDSLTAKKVLYPLIERPSPSLRDAYEKLMHLLSAES